MVKSKSDSTAEAIADGGRRTDFGLKTTENRCQGTDKSVEMMPLNRQFCLFYWPAARNSPPLTSQIPAERAAGGLSPPPEGGGED